MPEKRSEQIIQIVAVTVLVVGCLMVLKPFLAAILCAAILSFSTWPAYEWVERKVGGRGWLAALIMTLLFVMVVVMPLVVVALTYADEVPQIIERVRDTLSSGLPDPPSWVASIPLVGESIDAGWHDLAGNRAKLTELLKRVLQPAREGLVSASFLIGEGAIQFTLIAFIAYFFYRDGAALAGALRNALSRVAGSLTEKLIEIVGGTVTGVVYGIVGTGIAQGIVALIGFLIAGIPGALMLGFLTFFLSMVPAGPPLIWLSATAWLAYKEQPGWAIFMAIWGIVVISGIDNIVKPLLISRGSSLPFVLALLGVLGGALAFGFVGIFLGSVLIAVGFNLAMSSTKTRAQA